MLSRCMYKAYAAGERSCYKADFLKWSNRGTKCQVKKGFLFCQKSYLAILLSLCLVAAAEGLAASTEREESWCTLRLTVSKLRMTRKGRLRSSVHIVSIAEAARSLVHFFSEVRSGLATEQCLERRRRWTAFLRLSFCSWSRYYYIAELLRP